MSGTPPDFYSQRNCEQLLGLRPRTFLELIRRDDAPAVVKVGKARLVRRDAMLSYLERRESVAKATEPRAAEPCRLDGPDLILAEMGCKPSNTRSR